MNKHILALHTFAACVSEFAQMDCSLAIDLEWLKNSRSAERIDEITELARRRVESLMAKHLS